VLVAYYPVTRAGYIVDDENYVTENETLRDVAGLERIWLDLEATPQYYPLVYTSFWIEYRRWGVEPLGYHVVNVALHALNTLLVWALFLRLSIRGAWFAAALFALHPLHVESVAWVAERKNVLSVAFYLLSALVYFRFSGLDSPTSPGRWRLYALSLALFGAALLSKTATVSLPAALLLVIWWKRGRLRPADVVPAVPMFLLAAAMGLLTVWIETTRGGAIGDLWSLSWIERFLVASRALTFYGAKLIWPLGLSFNYERWTIDAAVWWQHLYLFFVIALLAGLWLLRKRIGRGPIVAVLFFAGTLAPTLGFFNVYFFRYSYVADHFIYPASLGLIALFGVGTVRLASRLGKARGVVGAIVLALLLGLSWTRARAFESMESICLDTLRQNPASWLANNNLGDVYMKRGDLERAISHFDTAVASAPTYIETHLNLAIAEMNRGRFDDAMRHARRAIEVRPQNMLGYYTLGDAALRAGRPGDAAGWFREALARDPDFTKAQLNLAVALTQTGRSEEAVEWFELVLRNQPDNVTALGNFGIALAGLGRFEAALEHLERALILDPENAALQRNLALIRQRAEP
jgi:tetratricopeptide (TPR) repeat protein